MSNTLKQNFCKMNRTYQNLRDYLRKTDTTAIDLYRQFKKECAKSGARIVQTTTFYMWCRLDSHATKDEHLAILSKLTGMDKSQLFAE